MVSVGRVMTCVLGMVVNREREIREFVKIPFYRILMQSQVAGTDVSLEWKATETSAYFQSPKLYKDNGFLQEADADAFIAKMEEEPAEPARIEKLEKKKETKNPLFYITWRNCKTIVPVYLRSAPTKPCESYRNFTKKN